MHSSRPKEPKKNWPKWPKIPRSRRSENGQNWSKSVKKGQKRGRKLTISTRGLSGGDVKHLGRHPDWASDGDGILSIVVLLASLVDDSVAGRLDLLDITVGDADPVLLLLLLLLLVVFLVLGWVHCDDLFGCVSLNSRLYYYKGFSFKYPFGILVFWAVYWI